MSYLNLRLPGKSNPGHYKLALRALRLGEMTGFKPVPQNYVGVEKYDRVGETRPGPLQLNIVCAAGVFCSLILICSGVWLVCVNAIEESV
jgi:hypothetical protein